MPAKYSGLVVWNLTRDQLKTGKKKPTWNWFKLYYGHREGLKYKLLLKGSMRWGWSNILHSPYGCLLYQSAVSRVLKLVTASLLFLICSSIRIIAKTIQHTVIAPPVCHVKSFIPASSPVWHTPHWKPAGHYENRIIAGKCLTMNFQGSQSCENPNGCHKYG